MAASLLRSKAPLVAVLIGRRKSVRADGHTTWPRRGGGPRGGRSSKRTRVEAILFNVVLAGLVLGAWPLSGTLPVWIYYLFVVAQGGILWRQIGRGNLLCAAAGSCLTAMLFIGVSIPGTWRPSELNGYLAGWLLTPSLTGLANRILLLTSCLYYAIAVPLAPAPSWNWKAPDPVERRVARIITPLLLVSSAVLYFLTRQGALVTSVPYPSNMSVDRGILSSNSGLALLAPMLLSFSLVAACRGYGLSSSRYRWSLAGTLLIAVCFSLLRGNRVGILFVVSTALLLFYLGSNVSQARKLFTMGIVIAGTFFLLQAWAHARTTAAEIGLLPAMAEGWNDTVAPLMERFDPLQVQLLPQSYWHLLDVEYLVANGLSIRGATVYGLVPQSIPESIARPLHIERPLNSAWLVGSYGMSSGGGMYIVAEGYWNFGMFGALGVAAILALIAVGLERWHQRQEPLLACTYFAFLGSLSFGIFYGLQPFARALEVNLALAFLLRWAMVSCRSALEPTSLRVQRERYASAAREPRSSARLRGCSAVRSSCPPRRA
jgi:hypothetical protein